MISFNVGCFSPFLEQICLISGSYVWLRTVSSDFWSFRLIYGQFRLIQTVPSDFERFRLILDSSVKFLKVTSDFRHFCSMSDGAVWNQTFRSDFVWYRRELSYFAQFRVIPVRCFVFPAALSDFLSDIGGFVYIWVLVGSAFFVQVAAHLGHTP